MSRRLNEPLYHVSVRPPNCIVMQAAAPSERDKPFFPTESIRLPFCRESHFQLSQLLNLSQLNELFLHAAMLQSAGKPIHHHVRAFIGTSVAPTIEDYQTIGSQTLMTWKLTNSQQAGHSTAGQPGETNRLQLTLGTDCLFT